MEGWEGTGRAGGDGRYYSYEIRYPGISTGTCVCAYR